MNIWLSCRCWSMARRSPWFLPFWVIKVNPFFITCDYRVQKTLSIMPGKQHFTCGKSAFNVFRRQFIRNPISFFLIIPNDFERCEIAFWVSRNVRVGSSYLWHESWSNNASNYASSYTFGLPLRSLSSMSNSPFLNFWNPSRQLLSFKAASAYVSTNNRCASAVRFLQIEEVNQKFPQTKLIRFKTRHFRTQ